MGRVLLGLEVFLSQVRLVANDMSPKDVVETDDGDVGVK